MISFGPVPSRRLGKSLGINNIPFPKACSYDCIYCQVGRTVNKRYRRESFYESQMIYDSVLSHLNHLRAEDHPDYLTLVSNGEPTLDVNLGRTIKLLKKIGVPVAVITNASMLIYKSVRDDLNQADWVSLKMDAGRKETFYLINRPVKGIDFERIINNIFLFSKIYKGSLNTETMLVKGVNDTEEEIMILADLIGKINPGRAYLSVPIRPPNERWVTPPEMQHINRAWQIYTSKGLRTELLTGFEGADTGFTGNIHEDILNITAVHPLREDALQKLIKNDNADPQVVESLLEQKLIKSVLYKGKKFFIRNIHSKNQDL